MRIGYLLTLIFCFMLGYISAADDKIRSIRKFSFYYGVPICINLQKSCDSQLRTFDGTNHDFNISPKTSFSPINLQASYSQSLFAKRTNYLDLEMSIGYLRWVYRQNIVGSYYGWHTGNFSRKINETLRVDYIQTSIQLNYNFNISKTITWSNGLGLYGNFILGILNSRKEKSNITGFTNEIKNNNWNEKANDPSGINFLTKISFQVSEFYLSPFVQLHVFYYNYYPSKLNFSF